MSAKEFFEEKHGKMTQWLSTPSVIVFAEEYAAYLDGQKTEQAKRFLSSNSIREETRRMPDIIVPTVHLGI